MTKQGVGAAMRRPYRRYWPRFVIQLLLSVPLKDSLSLAWRPASSLEEGAKGSGMSPKGSLLEGAKGSGMSPKGSLLEGAGTRSVTEGVGHWVVT